MNNYIYKGFLLSNVIDLGRRSLAGNPNIVLIFGPTRYGKSTLSFQIAKQISEICNVPFTDEHIDFDSNNLIKLASQGHKHHVYVLDEGAFQMMGEDWQNKANKALRKFFDTAAMYNQTFIINIPFIGTLHKSFVKNEHACGFRVNVEKDPYADDPKKMFKKGYCKIYKELLMSQWKGERADIPHNELWLWNADCPEICRFGPDISFIDEDKYIEKKKAAIKTLQEQDENEKEENYIRAAKLSKYLKEECKLSYAKIGEIIGAHENTIGRMIRSI